MPHPRYTLGIDLGQANDPTAIALIEHEPTPSPLYRVVSLHRFRLGTRYPTLVEQITARLNQKPLHGKTQLAIDATGVGPPVVDMFKQHHAAASDIYAITITGGDKPGGTGYARTVPKHILINTSVVLFQQRRIRIAADLPDTTALRDELLSYRIKTSETGHQSYGPASSREHDDLLLALSLALWIAEKNRPGPPPRTYVARGRIPTQQDRFNNNRKF